MPTAFAVRYWRKVLANPRGELWFGAHSHAARVEMLGIEPEFSRPALTRTIRPGKRRSQVGRRS